MTRIVRALMAEMDFQRHWLNPLLNLVCRVTGWNYYWYRYEVGGRRHLRIGSDDRSRR